MASDRPCRRRRRAGGRGSPVWLSLVFATNDADRCSRIAGRRGHETDVGAGEPANCGECAGAPQTGGNRQRARGGRDVLVEQDRSRRRAGRCRRPVAGAGHHRPCPCRSIAYCPSGVIDRRSLRLVHPHALVRRFPHGAILRLRATRRRGRQRPRSPSWARRWAESRSPIVAARRQGAARRRARHASGACPESAADRAA